MKDYFSEDSANYARYRPQYPPALFAYLEKILTGTQNAWDCGTGNGQIAVQLARFMEQVIGTDLSASQLRKAVRKENISYRCELAEQSSFPNRYFDLVTVGQAIHWFDFDSFYREVKRVLKPGGILAVIGYGLFKSNPETNELIQDFYKRVIGPYWDPKRKYLESRYENIPFPFQEIEHPDFSLQETWSLERLVGYLRTWSAVKYYQKKEGRDPVIVLEEKLKATFGPAERVEFPILLRIGKKKTDP